MLRIGGIVILSFGFGLLLAVALVVTLPLLIVG